MSKVRTFRITADVNALDIIESLAMDHDRKVVMQMILDLDESMCDYDFTLALTKSLVKALIESHGPTEPPLKMASIFPRGYKETA